ncbi:uncharacterized protein LAESUDRAFT_146380 [Laetiporus sulphureus 93-53]|uniref:C2H2-type domain-containing protein n=1 Tax=Laetiporus sulphureus 93-53 TaxID=1314785 RepID=A0A165EB20_9APHY|nr:uncharacterized protein LAESUDRAFT_146380 [Laetiporus sulphureus 93-53]KZT06633.1 hypothetical protein LAESUDRAFT_146380 [Laetiporus sulphureus 93-53]
MQIILHQKAAAVDGHDFSVTKKPTPLNEIHRALNVTCLNPRLLHMDKENVQHMSDAEFRTTAVWPPTVPCLRNPWSVDMWAQEPSKQDWGTEKLIIRPIPQFSTNLGGNRRTFAHVPNEEFMKKWNKTAQEAAPCFPHSSMQPHVMQHPRPLPEPRTRRQHRIAQGIPMQASRSLACTTASPQKRHCKKKTASSSHRTPRSSPRRDAKFFARVARMRQSLPANAQPNVQCRWRGAYPCTFKGTRLEVQEHIEQEHITASQVKCKWGSCETRHGFPKDLVRHLNLHEEIRVPYPCDFCGQKLSRRDALIRHMNLLH